MVLSPVLSNLPLFLILTGAALIIAEAFAPGAHFFVAGVSLFVAGLVGVLVGSVFGGLVVLLSMTVTVLVAAAVTLYGYRQLDIYGGTGQAQTSDSSSLRGQTGRVTERVTSADGEVKLDSGGFNPYYQARSINNKEIEEGTEVMVVDPGGGNVVTVEVVSNLQDGIDRELEREAARQHEQSSE
jgi:Membrane protein implicated in regulation of membrane protease activity